MFKLFQKPVMLLVVFMLVLSLNPANPAAAQTTLQQSIKAAFAYSPDLKAEKERHQVASLAVDRAKGGRLPAVQASAGGGFSQISDSLNKMYDQEDKFRSFGETSLRLIQPLWHGGAITSEIGASEAGAAAAASTLEDDANFLALNVIAAHLDVVRRKSMLELAKTNVAEHAKTLDTVRQRYESKVSTIGELNQVQSRYSKAKATLLAYETAYENARSTYRRLTGQYPVSLLQVSMPRTTYDTVQIARAVCMRDNLRIKAAIEDVNQMQKQQDNAKSNYLPRVNLEMGHNWNDRDGDAPSSFHSLDAMVRLQWNLYNGGQDSKNVSMQKARLREAKQTLHAVMDMLNEDVENTFTRWQSYILQEQEYREAKEASRITKDDYSRQFLASKRSLIDVLDAENDIFSAAGQELLISGEKTVAAYRLLALTGNLLSELDIKADDLKEAKPTTTEDIRDLKLNIPSTLNTMKPAK